MAGARTAMPDLTKKLCYFLAFMFCALLAFLCIVGSQVVFWTFTFPANQATVNWTEIPENWEALRTRWEYSHAAGAGLNLVAMISLVLSVLAWRSADHAELAGPAR